MATDSGKYLSVESVGMTFQTRKADFVALTGIELAKRIEDGGQVHASLPQLDKAIAKSSRDGLDVREVHEPEPIAMTADRGGRITAAL